MSNVNNIKRRLVLNLLNNIKKAASSDAPIIEIVLCNIDESAIYDAYMEILNKLTQSGALNNFTVKTIRVTEPNINEPQKPSELEIAYDPVVLDNYYQAMEHHKEHATDYVGEKYFLLVLNFNDLNCKKIDNILQKTTPAPKKKVEEIVKLLDLPENISWENITIKFIDGHDVNVIIDKNGINKTIKVNYAQLGFMDKRKRKPNLQWVLLKGLSSNDGKTSWSDSLASPMLKKSKQLLAQTLRNAFGITNDPFYPYRQNKCYEIKIQLIPE